jgi:hypothetical protein
MGVFAELDAATNRDLSPITAQRGGALRAAPISVRRGPVTYVGRWYLDDAHRLLTVESGFGRSLGPESLTRRLLLEKSPISAGPLAVESGARDSAMARL